jgi:hypothetical protein
LFDFLLPVFLSACVPFCGLFSPSFEFQRNEAKRKRSAPTQKAKAENGNGNAVGAEEADSSCWF